MKVCCPQGFLEVRNYCAKCTAPNVFDPLDQTCKPCPADHLYSNITQRCECFSCELPRKFNPVNNKCECEADDKGLPRIFLEDKGVCACPANLPLWNGKYCVACPTGTEYDPNEQQCYHCPEGFVRDIVGHACIPGL